MPPRGKPVHRIADALSLPGLTPYQFLGPKPDAQSHAYQEEF